MNLIYLGRYKKNAPLKKKSVWSLSNTKKMVNQVFRYNDAQAL